MDNVATANINNLRISEADFVPSSEQTISISRSDLRQIISEAVQDALQPLQDRIESLEATVASQGEEIATLTATQDTQADNQLIQLRLINQLREAKKEPGKTETTRAEKIERYLQSRPDRRATFETLKGMLQVDNIRLNEAIKVLIATSDRSYIIQKEKTGDKRKRSLIMLPR